MTVRILVGGTKKLRKLGVGTIVTLDTQEEAGFINRGWAEDSSVPVAPPKPEPKKKKKKKAKKKSK